MEAKISLLPWVPSNGKDAQETVDVTSAFCYSILESSSLNQSFLDYLVRIYNLPFPPFGNAETHPISNAPSLTLLPYISIMPLNSDFVSLAPPSKILPKSSIYLLVLSR